MPLLPILVWVFVSQNVGAFAVPIDVTAVTIGLPALVADLDLGKLKGDLRQVGWSTDGSQLYVQTVEGNPQNEKAHHYTVAREGGVLQPVDREPDWATAYWTFKSDRSAPGVPTLVIDVRQKRETTKLGTGSSRPGTMAASGAANAENASRASEGQTDAVVRFILLDQTVSEFVDERPIPGLMFGWGPRGSSAIAYTDRQGHLMLLDGEKRQRTVAGVKDVSLPAWSTDGERLAYVVKEGRRKYKLVWCTITK